MCYSSANLEEISGLCLFKGIIGRFEILKKITKTSLRIAYVQVEIHTD